MYLKHLRRKVQIILFIHSSQLTACLISITRNTRKEVYNKSLLLVRIYRNIILLALKKEKLIKDDGFVCRLFFFHHEAI